MSAKHHKSRSQTQTGGQPRLSPRPENTTTRPGGTATATDQPSPTGPSATLPPQQVPSPQKKPTLDMIRERAYFKWVEAGSPASDGREFWEKAEAEVNGMSGEWAETGNRTASG